MRPDIREGVFNIRLAGALIRKSRRWVLLGLCIGLAIGSASAFVVPREFVAKTAFVPLISGTVSQASDLLRGLSVGQMSAASIFGTGSTSADIYPDLIRSSRVLRDALSRNAPLEDGSDQRSFRDRLGFDRGDSSIQTTRAIQYVKRRMRVTVSRANNLVEIQFTNADAGVAASFLRALLECLNDFNTNVRQSQAGGVRRFLERRIVESRSDLEVAENDLTLFRLRNLRYQNSPRLAIEEARLQRRVRLSESVFQTLTAQFELAKIDEARDTPTLTIVEPPFPPSLPSGFGFAERTLLGALIGLSTASMWAARGAWSSSTM